MKRSYRGPIIDRKIEAGIVNGWDTTKIPCPGLHALAVDDITGELIILYNIFPHTWVTSHANNGYHRPFTGWTVTP